MCVTAYCGNGGKDSILVGGEGICVFFKQEFQNLYSFALKEDATVREVITWPNRPANLLTTSTDRILSLKEHPYFQATVTANR